MSTTATQSVTATGLLHVSEDELRRYSQSEDAQKSVKTLRDIGLSTPCGLVCESPEDLLALLTAGLPTTTIVNTENDQDDDNLGNEKVSVFDQKSGKKKIDQMTERIEAIMKLRRLLGELRINGDDELFKTSYLNVGKYVVGPAPAMGAKESAMDEGLATEEAVAEFDKLNIGAEGTPGIDPLHAGGVVGIPAMSTTGCSDVEEDVNGHVQNHANGSLDMATAESSVTHVHTDRTEDIKKTIEKPVAQGHADIAQTIQQGVIDDGKPPRIPPNTPVAEERVWWSNEFFIIKKSALGGLGVFAAKDLYIGDTILEELPLLRTNTWKIHNDFDNLSIEDRELFFTLHRFSPTPGAHVIEQIRRANSFAVPAGVTIYSVTSRFNHACDPRQSVSYEINGRKDGDGKITLTMLKDVPKGTELTITYGGSPETLLRGFGFRCQCGGCRALNDVEVEDILNANKGNGYWTTSW